ncbi:MAG: hypothetical protein WC657_07880 [Candidatus Paceibacterota bacterium]|jgi:hypothetical protein
MKKVKVPKLKRPKGVGWNGKKPRGVGWNGKKPKGVGWNGRIGK